MERKRSDFVSLAPVGKNRHMGLVLIGRLYFRVAKLYRIAETDECHLERRERIGFHLS